MKPEEASAIVTLSNYPEDTIIADIYDDNDDIPEAIGVLIPGFEYPDISHKTVGEIFEMHEKAIDKAWDDLLEAAEKIIAKIHIGYRASTLDIWKARDAIKIIKGE